MLAGARKVAQLLRSAAAAEVNDVMPARINQPGEMARAGANAALTSVNIKEMAKWQNSAVSAQLAELAAERTCDKWRRRAVVSSL